MDIDFIFISDCSPIHILYLESYSKKYRTKKNYNNQIQKFCGHYLL